MYLKKINRHFNMLPLTAIPPEVCQYPIYILCIGYLLFEHMNKYCLN